MAKQSALEREIVMGTLRLLDAYGFLVLTAPGDKLLTCTQAVTIIRGQRAGDRPCAGVVWRANSGVAITEGMYASVKGSPASRFTRSRRFVRYGLPGMSDICGVLADGRFLAIECKRRGELLSQEQVSFQAMIELLGGVTAIVREPEQIRDYVGSWNNGRRADVRD